MGARVLTRKQHSENVRRAFSTFGIAGSLSFSRGKMQTKTFHDPGVDKQFKPHFARAAQPFYTRWQGAVTSSPTDRATAAIRPLAGTTVLTHKRADCGHRANRVAPCVSNVQENLPLHRSSRGKSDVNAKRLSLRSSQSLRYNQDHPGQVLFPFLLPYIITDKYC